MARKIMAALLFVLAMPCFYTLNTYAQVAGPIGFANYNDLGLAGVTGGGAGETVMVDSRKDFDAAVASDEPRTIILTATITGDGVEQCNDEVMVGSNKTIMALSPEVKINGINLVASGKHNIILRNITLLNGKPDGLTFKNCHHVWIDHCDLSACDDGLLDFTLGSSYMTVSYCKIHNHNKVSLCNSGTQHFEDVGKQRVTYHHNYWYQNTQRNPRIGYGLGHVFNNYYENISSYCIGYHSSAKVLSENNHFAASAKNPLQSMYSSDPNWVTYAEARDRGSYVANGNIGTQQGTVFEPADYYDYAFALEEAAALNQTVTKEAGPQVGLCDELMLYPGNGATDVTSDVKPLCLGYADSELRISTTPGASASEPWTAEYKLQPETTYYWYAIANGKQSPVYQFRTAKALASQPYPLNGETQANLREAVAEKQFNGNMKLRWRPAFDAKKYKVVITDGAAFSKEIETTECYVDPGFLRHNTQYQWTVTPLSEDGNALASAPETWTFSAAATTIKTGTTLLADLTRNARAFLQPFNSQVASSTGDMLSVKNVVVPDAGPGCVMATFDGDDGTRVEFSLSFRNKETTPGNSGKSYFAVYVNDQQVEWWQGHQATSDFYIRTLGKHIVLNKGDEIRVEFYTTIQSSNWTQLAWIKLKKSSADDEYPEPQEGRNPSSEYVDPFVESWWPNATTFHAPKTAEGQDYEIVYFPAYETSTKGIYKLNDSATAEWVDGRFHINNRKIYSPEKDDLRSIKTTAGIVCGESGTMADGISYPCIFSMSLEQTSHIRCYVAGSSSYKNRMKVTVIPVGDEGGQFDTYSTTEMGKDNPGYVDIDLDPSNRYRLLFNGERPYAMFLGAVRLYKGDMSGITPVVADRYAESAAFNLSGQRVTSGYKGIIIKNGKKQTIK